MLAPTGSNRLPRFLSESAGQPQPPVEWFAGGIADRDDLPEGYRPFDARWVADGSMDVADRRFDQRHRWMFRFHRLGILDAYGVTGAFTG